MILTMPNVIYPLSLPFTAEQFIKMYADENQDKWKKLEGIVIDKNHNIYLGFPHIEETLFSLWHSHRRQISKETMLEELDYYQEYYRYRTPFDWLILKYNLTIITHFDIASHPDLQTDHEKQHIVQEMILHDMLPKDITQNIEIIEQ